MRKGGGSDTHTYNAHFSTSTVNLTARAVPAPLLPFPTSDISPPSLPSPSPTPTQQNKPPPRPHDHARGAAAGLAAPPPQALHRLALLRREPGRPERRRLPSVRARNPARPPPRPQHHVSLLFLLVFLHPALCYFSVSRYISMTAAYARLRPTPSVPVLDRLGEARQPDGRGD